jgi:hypothetical protein
MTSQQGNYKYNNYGNRSILLTGNVTGSVSDIGLMYYNPARLTSIETSGIAFNAKAYQFNSLEIDPLITDNDPISRNSFTTVPALVGGTFKLFDERFAYTFLSKYRTNRKLSASYNRLNETVLENFPEAQALFLSTSISNEIRDDWYGLSWAHKFENDLSIGISVFGADYKYRGLRSSNQTFEYEPNKVSTGLIQYSFDQQSYGLHVKLGANYTINNVDLGINLHLPYLEVYGSGKYRLNQTVAGSIDDRDKFYDYDFTELTTARKIPLGISAGAGISINKSQIHVNIDYRDGLSEYQRLELPMVDLGDTTLTEITFNERRYAVLNFGIGGELFISEKLQSFFGFSTDFNSYRGETEFFDFRTTNADELNAGTDYFHLSGGVDWELKWGSIIFGLTFTRGKNNISLNSDPLTGLIADFNNTTAVVSHRLQFIVGFEIPFLDKGVKNFRDNFKFN